MYIKRRKASLFQTIFFCCIHIIPLTRSHSTVKINSPVNKETSIKLHTSDKSRFIEIILPQAFPLCN